MDARLQFRIRYLSKQGWIRTQGDRRVGFGTHINGCKTAIQNSLLVEARLERYLLKLSLVTESSCPDPASGTNEILSEK